MRERRLQQRRRRRAPRRDTARRNTRRTRSRSRTSRRVPARAAGSRATARCRSDCRGCTGTAPRSASRFRPAPQSRSGWKRLSARGVEEHGLRAGEQRRAFVDLIERIRHRDHGLRVRPLANHRLHEREQRFARAVHRQHHRFRIDAPTESEAALEPGRAGRARSRAVPRSPDSCRACREFARSVSTTNGGGACFGSPIDIAMCGRPAGGVMPLFSRASRSNGYAASSSRRPFTRRRGGRARRTASAAAASPRPRRAALRRATRGRTRPRRARRRS